MVSRTKIDISNQEIVSLFQTAGIESVEKIEPLGSGEYNAVFSVRASGADYALKIAPPEGTAVMTYEKDLMASEIFWYDQVRQRTSIPVPGIVHTDFSRRHIRADYFIMEKIAGVQLDKMIFTESEKKEAAEVTARYTAQLHTIRGDGFGYIQNGLYDDWYQAIRSMVQAVIDDGRALGYNVKRGYRLLELIEGQRDVLEKAPCTMVSFDMWPPNILCTRQPDGIRYSWIDPERSFWGDPVMDFICLEITRPLAEKKISLEAYNALADHLVTASEEEEIRYAVAQGYLSLIFEVEKYYRYSPLHFGWWRNLLLEGLMMKPAFRTLGGTRG